MRTDAFAQSVSRQIRVNQSRTPTERFLALCDLLDATREMAPQGEPARQRRSRALAARQRDREQWREQLRQIVRSQSTPLPRSDDSASI